MTKETMHIVKQAVVLDIYSETLNKYLNTGSDDFHERFKEIEFKFGQVGCWGFDFIDWSVRGDHITVTTEFDNAERVEEFAKELEGKM
jgi:hypothetical protein